MKFKSCLVRIFLTVSLLVVLSRISYASNSTKDISTISRAIGFMQNGPKGALDMAIAYDPDNQKSTEHAANIEKLSSKPVGTNRVKLKGKKVRIDKLNSLNDYKVVFVTEGIARKYKRALEEVQKRGGVTVSTDAECLSVNACLLSIKSGSAVEISMNTEVERRTRVRFASAFRMMIIRK